MRVLVLILWSFLSVFTVKAQKVHFTDFNNRWVVDVRNNSGFQRERSFYTYDTVLGAKKYRIMMSNEHRYGIREDTALKRVYLRNVFSSPPFTDTTDYLLYRYDLQLGDTVSFNHPNPYTDSVVAIDSVLINGVYHRSFTLRNKNSNWSMLTAYSVIEGIGALDGPLYPFGYSCWGEYESQLVCFGHNGVYPPMNYQTQNCKRLRTFTNPGTCTDSFSLAVSSVSSLLIAGLYPNPFSGQSVLRFSQLIKDGQLAIYDGLGRCVYRQSIRNRQEIPVGGLKLSTGSYYFRVTEGHDGQLAAGRFSVL